MSPTTRRLLRLALPPLAALGAGAAVAFAAIPAPDGTIHACIDPASTPPGAVRIIDDATQACAAGETPLSWSQTGPGGPAGPPGPQGEARPARAPHRRTTPPSP